MNPMNGAFDEELGLKCDSCGEALSQSMRFCPKCSPGEPSPDSTQSNQISHSKNKNSLSTLGFLGVLMPIFGIILAFISISNSHDPWGLGNAAMLLICVTFSFLIGGIMAILSIFDQENKSATLKTFGIVYLSIFAIFYFFFFNT